MHIDKNNLDIAQIFLVYMSLVGDVERTAQALDMDPAAIAELAIQEGWAKKIQRLTVISSSGKPGDWERAQNRALNYVQAHILRQQIDRVSKYVRSLTDKELINEISTPCFLKGEKIIAHRISARFFSDLAAAMEKVQALTYAALGDSMTERRELGNPNGSGPGETAASIHAAVIAALNSPKALTPKTSDLLIEEALDVADAEAAQVIKPQVPESEKLDRLSENPSREVASDSGQSGA